VNRSDVEKREGILIKKALGIAMATKQDVVRNIYGVHYSALGDDIAYAATRLRKNTEELNGRTSVEWEHLRFEELIDVEDRLKEADPEVFALYQE
jgi:hypothetical protein